MKSSPILEEKLKQFCIAGEIVPRTENNAYLKVSYCGSGKTISPKWNVKIYTSGSIVCNDMHVLEQIINNTFSESNPELKVVQIDDAGIGFPLFGVMVGVTVQGNSEVYTDVVPVHFFQDPLFESKAYLKEYSRRGRVIISKLKIEPTFCRIEICSGYINTVLRDDLRKQGFDVRVVDIKGLLQDRLEILFKEFVNSKTLKDLAFDPKGLDQEAIAKKYYSALNWGKHYAPHLLKSGWPSIKKALENNHAC